MIQLKIGGMKDIMSTQEAARYLEVSPFTILRLIKRKSIEAEKFGNYWMIDKSSVVEYKKRNEDKDLHDPTRG